MLTGDCDRENPAEVALGPGDYAYTWDTPVYVDEVRVIFDSDLNHAERAQHAVPSYPLNMPKDPDA